MATQKMQVYRCNVCGNMVVVIRGAGGTLTCCNQAMELLVENTQDAALEKHVPQITPVEGGIKVQVGSVAHPMQPEHYIEWIEVESGGQVCRQFLEPRNAPEAFFPIEAGAVTVREFCNVHGLWKA